MKQILNPIQIQAATLKITCGGDQGTAFFISNDVLLTAYHVVSDAVVDNKEIFISQNSNLVQCTILSYDKDMDVCLIKAPNASEIYLPLLSATVKAYEKSQIFGFPYKHEAIDKSLNGRISQIVINDKSDFVIGNLGIDPNYDYEGFSGAPVVVNGKIIGVVLRQIDDQISAISIYKINDFLITNKVTAEDEYFYDEVPGQFKEEFKKVTPNYATLEKIDETILFEKNWFLLSGSPGCGKSIIAASYESEHENVVICGKYFVKVPNDLEPSALRASTTFFLETLENLISRTVTGFPSPKEDTSFENRIRTFSQALEELGNYYKAQKQVALIIIDGLDEVTNLTEFLGIFPEKLPDNLKILLSCTSKEILPIGFQNLIDSAQEIPVTAIDLGQCEAFIMKEVGRGTFPVDAIQILAAKSEGHPLYLRYLVNFISNHPFSAEGNELNEWLQSIPSIEGDITKYYNTIWAKLAPIPDRLWICIILSRLRQAIVKEELYTILPESYQLTFHTHYPTLKYLMRNEDNIEIYHNSFKDFIISKTMESGARANDLISNYCEKNIKTKFAVNNIIYHYANSSHPSKAISFCDQRWADLCVVEGVAPDLALSDIKLSIHIATTLKNAAETIRLLLLLQRIEFRYDDVFAENANLIALALCSLKRFADAIKYIVRDDTLLVDNFDAIKFLQIFYENNANREAALLAKAIGIRYRKLLSEGEKSDNSYLDLSAFHLQFSAFTLGMNVKDRSALNKWMSLSSGLKKMQDHSLQSGDTGGYESINNVREQASAWQCAYVLRRFGHYIDSETATKFDNGKLNEKWAKVRALSILYYKSMDDYNTPKFEVAEKYKDLIEDTEYLIQQYGYGDSKGELQILISALIDDSANSQLVAELIKKSIPLDDSLGLRKANGVDVDYAALYNLYFTFKCKGYIDANNDYPNLVTVQYRHAEWEKYLLSLIKYLGFCEGKLAHFQAEKASAEVAEVNDYVQKLLLKIDFSFEERSYWDESYHLPESALTFIYTNIINIIIKYDKANLDGFISHIAGKGKNQLSIYSEGYRNTLSEVVKGLIKADCESSQILAILSLWEVHILRGVENRWERTQELLKIVEAYALIDEGEKANNIFLEMLQTSMGPTWYKEDQLDLLNTILGFKVKGESLNEYYQKFAALMDYASGEMTFQRYVRYSKESFIENLIAHSKLKKAIEYFKNEVLPEPPLLIHNAESSSFDATKIGHGYCLGARNISEEGGILNLLSQLEELSPFVRLALIGVYIVNTDTDRFLRQFARQQAQGLNALEKKQDSFLDEAIMGISGIAASKEMKDTVQSYLASLGEYLSGTNKIRLQGHLLTKNISWNISTNINEAKPNFSKKTTAFSTFNQKFEKEKATKKKALIREALEAFKTERVGFWISNWSIESDDAKKNIKSLLETSEEVIECLQEYIITYGNEPWIITDQILGFLQGKLSNADVEKMYNVIYDHFCLLIRPNETAVAKYDWLNEKSQSDNTNTEICRLIIWLLNHPVNAIKSKAYLAIISLFKFEPQLVLNCLFEEVLAEKPNSSTTCSEILLEISKNNGKTIADFVSVNKGISNKLSTVSHFLIKMNLLKMAGNLRLHQFEHLFNSISERIPKVVILVGRVNVVNNSLDPISYEINRLNELQLLNADFEESLLSNITLLCQPLTMTEVKKSDNYLRRSYFLDYRQDGRFENILRHALNVTVAPRVDCIHLDQVYEILNN